MTTTTPAPHYRWSELEADSPLAQLSRRRVIGEQAMVAQVRLERGCEVPSHEHDNEQFACILEGALRFHIGADKPDAYDVIVRAGEVLHLPSGVPHGAVAIEDTLVLDVFSPPSEGTGIDQSASS